MPAPRAPGPVAPSGLFGAFVKACERLSIFALLFVAALVVKSCNYHLFESKGAAAQTSQYSAPSTPWPRSTTEQAPPAESVNDTPYTPSLESIIGAHDWIYASVVEGAAYDGDLADLVASLRARRVDTPSAEDHLAIASARAQIDAYASGGAVDARAVAYGPSERLKARDQLRRNLQVLLRQHPRAAEIAFELGWMFLLDKDVSMASRYFKHAIAMAPSDPSGWYGWGVIATRVDDMYGALSLAEGLATDEAQMRKLRERFPVAMMPIIGLDEERLAIVSARARVRTSTLTNAVVPADTRALAARPLPQ